MAVSGLKDRAAVSIYLSRVLFLILTLFTASLIASGQQTVFNVPTTDVLDKGKVYFELDVSAKPNDSDALNKFSSFVPRIVIGTGSRVEVGLNITGNVQPGADSTTLVPAVKWRVYSSVDSGWAMALGSHMFIPVRDKAYSIGNHSYVMVQKSFKTRTRVGFGAGIFTRDVVAHDAVRGTGMFTFEQPITDRFVLASDWYTGKHANGFWTSGGYYKFTKKVTAYGSYSVGNANASRGNHFLYFELGYNFN